MTIGSITPPVSDKYVPSAKQRAFRPFGSAKEVLYNKVPILGVYGPAGTGKSRTCLEKIHLICEKYPNARCMIARKTRESLTEAALFTYEEKVLPIGHPINPEQIKRSHRQQYHYPNGSLIVVCGLDKPQKIMSTEFDIIYVQEAIECDPEDFEMLTTRLRNSIVPYQQLIFDCNPDKPGHWIWQGGLIGRWPLIHSIHEDNPTLFEEAPPDIVDISETYPIHTPDGRIGRWTQNGERYINILENLTGARYERLRHGRWVGSEGVVYERFNSHIHIWDDCDGKVPWFSGRPPKSYRRIWSVDFGYTHPMVIQKYAIDPDGRLYLYEEHYHTKVLVEEMASQALLACGYVYNEDTGLVPIADDVDELPNEIICDWDAEGRATLEKAVGIRTTSAIKNISGGIQAVEKRLKVLEDGKPRIFFKRNAVVAIDKTLKDEMKPTSTIEEFDGYVWDVDNGRKKGEVPIDKDNHGMDPLRYVIAYLDGIYDDELKAKDVAMGANVDPTSMIVGIPAKQSHMHNTGIGVMPTQQSIKALISGNNGRYKKKNETGFERRQSTPWHEWDASHRGR